MITTQKSLVMTETQKYPKICMMKDIGSFSKKALIIIVFIYFLSYVDSNFSLK